MRILVKIKIGFIVSWNSFIILKVHKPSHKVLRAWENSKKISSNLEIEIFKNILKLPYETFNGT